GRYRGYGIPGLEIRGRLVIGSQLDDDLRRARQELLGCGLHGFARDVCEDILTAGHIQHVVEETNAPARIQVPECAWLVAEAEQRAWTWPAGDFRANGIERPAQGRHHTLRARDIARCLSKSRHRREDVCEAAVHVAEPRDAGAIELL